MSHAIMFLRGLEKFFAGVEDVRQWVVGLDGWVAAERGTELLGGFGS
jgi:hypothetical protein